MAPLIGAERLEERLAAIARLHNFRAAHEEARLRKKAGELDVIFPHGTYLAVQRWAVPVEPAPILSEARRSSEYQGAGAFRVYPLSPPDEYSAPSLSRYPSSHWLAGPSTRLSRTIEESAAR